MVQILSFYSPHLFFSSTHDDWDQQEYGAGEYHNIDGRRRPEILISDRDVLRTKELHV